MARQRGRYGGRLVVPLAVFASALVPVLAVADEVPGAISGTVTDLDGEPLVDIVVGIDEASTTTLSDGSYELADVPPGDHTVEAHDPSLQFRPATQPVGVASDETTEDVDFALVPVEPEVVRVAGVDRVATAVEASRHAFRDGAPAAVIASDRDFPDALAAAPLAAQLDGPVLITGTRLDARVRDELRRLAVETVTIVGGVRAVNVVVQTELDLLGFHVERIAGEDRYDTAALVARRVGAPDGTAVLVDSRSFVGALVAAPLGVPILLRDGAGIPRDTADALRALGVERTIEIDGSDPYEASVRAAELVLERGGSLAIVHAARADAFPDSLAAARTGVPLLLVHPRNPTESDAVWQLLDDRRQEVGRIVVFGGEEAVEPDVVARLGRLGRAS